MNIKLGQLLTHRNFIDVDMKVVDILQESEDKIQLAVLYINKKNGIIHNLGETDLVTIKKSELGKWYAVS